MKPGEKSGRVRTVGNGIKVHPSLIILSCSSRRPCSRSLPREAETPQLAVPIPHSTGWCVRQSAPGTMFLTVWKELYLNRCYRNFREAG